MSLIFYAHPLSTYCAKVRIILKLKTIDFVEQLPLGGSYHSNAYHKLIAAGSVPAIQDGSFVLHDSDAIAEYLEDCCPVPTMRAPNSQQRAYHRSVARYHDTRLEPALRALFGFIGESGADRADAALSVLTDCLSRLANLVDPAPYLWAEQLCLSDCAYPTTLFMIQDVSAALGKTIELPAKLQAWQSALYEDQTIQQVVDDNRAAVAGWIDSKQKSRIT
ncbi:MAG: glutathione S-transferase family protein [Gammaproteobacteria bacterium]|nr:glutathione S-transferase family protein [Gammaproteobacteria bacterium]